MYLLSQEESIKIKNRVALAEVHNASLSVDLVDHICCMIEERVERGTKLNAAEEEVFKEMGEVQLKAIDIETKFLTQNKFAMKKRTKIIGIIAFILLITGFTFKMFHLPGAGILWGIGVITAAFGFFLFSLIDRFSYEKSSLMKASAVIGYIGSALLIVGLGLVLLRWPIAVYLAESGSVLLLAYFILNNAISRNASDSK
ncbi:MAG: hypothetical protein DRI71_09035 [Bacteroidetes bacterium]|nr:MAG: hypothetical protein DRI71_09035 [Bacteroidota bacterium]